MSPTMHADEVPIDVELVRRLLNDQFPRWAHLPLSRIESGGTVNAIYRLGTEMAVRLPLARWGTESLDREFLWSPRLAPSLPLAVPVPLVQGHPGSGYPFSWSIHRWLDGEMATVENVSDLVGAASELARFVRALQAIDTAGGPLNTHRGLPLVSADGPTRAAIDQLNGVIDTGAATAAWERALATPRWDRPPVWIHGDLWHSNLLVRDGHITTVIDFGNIGVGDPAIDMVVAWSLLDATSRAVYRSELAVDDPTWERGRGWALSMAVQALPYYADTNPVIVHNGHRMIGAVLAGT